MLVGDSNSVSRAQRTRDYVYRVARHLTNEVSNQVNIKIGRVRRGGRFVGKAKAQEVEGVDAKVPCQIVEIFSPHEAGGASAHSMNEDQGRSVVLRARSFVKHPAMFPTKEVGL